MGTVNLRHQMLQRLSVWAQSSPNIQAAAVVGSGARQDHPADEWSDIDLILVADRPADYLDQAAWCGEIAEPWVQTVERAENGKIVERRVLFRSGLDVDFIVLDGQDPQALLQEPFAGIIRRGLRVLVDKRGIFHAIPAEDAPVAHQPALSPEEFSELINDFWFHAVWTAKKIKRGELWTAKSCCDIYLKRLLLRMIECHAACLSNRQTWYSGRFIEQWAAPEVLERLPGIFATYAEDSVWQALRNTMDLFDILACETGEKMGYSYNREMANSISSWVGYLR